METDNKGRFKRTIGVDQYDGFTVYYDKRGYALICVDGKDIKLHVLIWEKENGPKPQGYDLHHIDCDKSNYWPSNIILLSRSDHQRIHAGWKKTGGRWSHKPCSKCGRLLPLNCFYERSGYTPSAKCKKCHCIESVKWARKNPVRRKKIANKSYHKTKNRRRRDARNIQETKSS